MNPAAHQWIVFGTIWILGASGAFFGIRARLRRRRKYLKGSDHN